MDAQFEILRMLELVLRNQDEIYKKLEELQNRLAILSPPPQPLVRQTAVLNDDLTPTPIPPPPPPPQSLLVLKRQDAQLGVDEDDNKPPPALPLTRQNAVLRVPSSF